MLLQLKTGQLPKAAANNDDRDICKTVDSTPQTANRLDYRSFYVEFLVHGGFEFVKLSQTQENFIS